MSSRTSRRAIFLIEGASGLAGSMSIPCLPCLQFVCTCEILYGREGKIAYACECNRMRACRAPSPSLFSLTIHLRGLISHCTPRGGGQAMRLRRKECNFGARNATLDMWPFSWLWDRRERKAATMRGVRGRPSWWRRMGCCGVLN